MERAGIHETFFLALWTDRADLRQLAPAKEPASPASSGSDYGRWHAGGPRSMVTAGG